MTPCLQNGNSLNSNSPSNTYVTATIFSLAHPYGTPTILSSYSFSDTDAGAPNGGTGTCTGTGGENGWLCQHRWVAFSGMVGFRNNVGDAELTDGVSPQSEQIAFGRGRFLQEDVSMLVQSCNMLCRCSRLRGD